MKALSTFAMLSLLLLAACRTDKAPTSADSGMPSPTAGEDTTVAPDASDAPQQSSPTITPRKPAGDLMFFDLEQGSKGRMYYRGAPFSGSVWMNYERICSCTYSDGGVASYTYYHSGGRVAAVCSPKGKLQECFDVEGLVLTPDSFSRRYPDMRQYIDSTF